jgi:AcrR family transcriptional regulator
MAKKKSNRERIITAALALAESDGWVGLSMADIATKAKLKPAEVLREFPSKTGLLWGILESIDHTVLAEKRNADEPPRDRLFDVLMSRFDALNAHKGAIKAIARGVPRDPLMSLLSAPRFMMSMAWMLEAAGISSAGLKGLLRTKGLALVYLNAARVWLRDDSADMSKTMAALDKGLRRAERFTGMCKSSRTTTAD